MALNADLRQKWSKRIGHTVILSTVAFSLVGCVLEPLPPEPPGPPPAVVAAPGYAAPPAYYAQPCCYSYYNYPGPYYYGGPEVGVGFYGGRGGRWR